MGALPESGVREFIERHLPRPADDHLADAAFRQGAHKLIHCSAIAKHPDGGETADAVSGCEFLLALRIHFGHPELSVLLERKFIEYRHQHFAGPTPLGPEVHQHWRGL